MKILLAIRDPAYEQTALRFGASLACNADDPPTIMTVVEEESARPQALSALERARQGLAEFPTVHLRVRTGHAAREIVREAAEGGYHLVVVGDRRSPNLLTLAIAGSTAVRVVEHAPCPVIVAKGKMGPVRRILLCDSGAVGPLAGFPLAPSWKDGTGSRQPSMLTRFTAQLAGFLQGEEEITVLHVMSQMSAGPGVRGTQLRAGVDELIHEHTPEGELLTQDIQVLGQPRIQARPKVRHGLVVDEVLDEAKSGDYDLVVIGAHRGEGWQRILLDDLAHKILVQLDRPVLVVR